MRINHIIIISLTFLVASMLSARQVKNPLGRFAQTDSSYDYSSSENTAPDRPYNTARVTLVRDQGGLWIAGFPEGCAYANVNQPLPDHSLGYGRIEFMGSSLAFQYRNRSASGPFSIAEVAKNVGIMGQDPEQDSVNLMNPTPGDKFVVAQLLDRSELGLGPIVTCISPVFRGTITPDQALVFGRDYYREYRRFRGYRWDRRNKWNKWRSRWKDKEFDWRKPWRGHRGDRDRDGGRDRDRDSGRDRGRGRDRDRDKADTSRRPSREGLSQDRVHIQIEDDDQKPRTSRIRRHLPHDKKAKRAKKHRPRVRTLEHDENSLERTKVERPSDDDQRERGRGRRQR